MPNETCTVRHINHTAIVVKDINDSISFYEDLFGVSSGPVEDIEDQGVKACLIKIGGTQLEIIQPVQADTGVAKFLEKSINSIKSPTLGEPGKSTSKAPPDVFIK